MKHLTGVKGHGACGFRSTEVTDVEGDVTCKRCIQKINAGTVVGHKIETGKQSDAPPVKKEKRKLSAKEEKKAQKVTLKAQQKAAAPPKPVQEKRVKEFPFCKCGCTDAETGERLRTRGGIFRPGHDARYHASLLPPKPAKEIKVKAVKVAKVLTGDHLLDTVLGMVGKMNPDQRKMFRAVVEERWFEPSSQMADEPNVSHLVM